MQFFYLVSFVAVVSNAAALPQPAGLSEKYSNNVDTNSASGLEARSYQPELNSRKDSATLMTETTTVNISATIDNVGDDGVPKMLAEGGEILEIYVAGVKAGARMGGDVGALLTRYLRRAQYVALALDRWREFEGNNVYGTIKSVLGEDEYSRISQLVIRRDIDLNNWTQDKLIEVLDAVSNIEKKYRL
ncbi:hypothetical protein BASA60_003464 [Batrachochytrium salamandrivorans]|nr:hypothetical protein BASA60_003464 [Batrachochytrium salamandrivorans]